MARLEEKFKNRALGKPQVSVAPPFNPLPPAPRDTLTEIALSQIERDPAQPRQDLGDLSELKASIASLGLVQPIIVTIAGYERYRIIAGERRFTAVRELNLSKIPAIVRTIEEHQRLEFQIVENLHRKDLNPVEEAQSYRRLMDEFGLTQEQVAERVGKSRVAVNEILRVLALPQAILMECRTSDIPKSLLLEIARRPAEEQGSLWEQAKAGELTVRKARLINAPEKKSGQTSGPSAASTTSPASMTFRYPIQTEEAVVTVLFNRPKATTEEIIIALEEALTTEKARRS